MHQVHIWELNLFESNQAANIHCSGIVKYYHLHIFVYSRYVECEAPILMVRVGGENLLKLTDGSTGNGHLGLSY